MRGLGFCQHQPLPKASQQHASLCCALLGRLGGKPKRNSYLNFEQLLVGTKGNRHTRPVERIKFVRGASLPVRRRVGGLAATRSERHLSTKRKHPAEHSSLTPCNSYLNFDMHKIIIKRWPLACMQHDSCRAC